ncbi:hypothetical protein HPB50_009535 [Hyalomma asiaticum]|uniref:Uncharacterized protein n=1 Tax=Hyalomma asiaticum TaxID=266040 RepID=A0ACB7RIF1_HYAAI|nr:hypothetical protein HPB50_009535 [Hyalomma asiaticum]
MRDAGATGRQQSCTVPYDPPPNSRCSENTGRYIFFSGCGLAVALFVVLGAVSFKILRQHPWKDGDDRMSFCCPREADELARYINSTVSPCKDFFAYACSSIINHKPSTSDDQHFQIMYSLITGADRHGKQKADAGRFLTAYFASCVRAIPRRESFFYSLANALVQHELDNLRHVNARGVLAYILAASVKYRMPSAVRVTFKSNRALMSLTVATICSTRKYTSDALIATVEALKKYLNMTLVLDGVVNFAVNICRKSTKVVRMKSTYTMPYDRASFNVEVWPMDAFEAILGPYGYRIQNETSISVQGVHRIRRLHDQLTVQDSAGATTATKIAYLVWHSVVSGSKVFYKSYDGSHPGAFIACLESLNDIWEAWDAFAAEMFTDLRTDAEALAVFASVKRAVYADCQSSKLFDVEDLGRLRNFLGGLTLVTPRDASQSSSLTVPNGTDDIGENILRGRVYSYEVATRRDMGMDDSNVVTYGFVQFMGDKHLVLPLSAYGYIGLGTNNHDVPNQALLGRMLAESLWYKMLGHTTWTARTTSNIDDFFYCVQRQRRIGDKDVPTDQLAVTVLGLLSALNALNKSSHWNVPRFTTNLWQVTEAQLFFILSTQKRCPASWSVSEARFFNASLLYVDEFATAFGCPTTEMPAKFSECFMRALPSRV